MNNFLRHGLLTLLGTVVLSGAVIAIFGWVEADREIDALCEFLDGASIEAASVTLATLSWSKGHQTDTGFIIDSRWNHRSSICTATLQDGKINTERN